MRRLLLGATALTAISAAAFAADLPARDPAVTPAPVYVAPIFTWSGFYIGLNAGVAFGGASNSGLQTFVVPGADPYIVDAVDYANAGLGARRGGNDDTGFTGGAQIGYNWQFGAMVAGIEADINYLDRNGGVRNFTVVGAGNYSGYELDVRSARSGSNWFGTLRPRIGVAFDRTLVYATGGLAYGGSPSGSATVTLYDGTDEVAAWSGRRGSGSNWGWTLGAGVEHAFSNNLSLKLEYLYVDLDRGGNGDLVRVSGNTAADQVYFRGGRSDDNFHVVRAGLNWRFGGPSYGASGPVVAAY